VDSGVKFGTMTAGETGLRKLHEVSKIKMIYTCVKVLLQAEFRFAFNACYFPI